MKTMLFTDCVDLVGSACLPFDGTKRYISTGAVDVDLISEADTELVDYEGRPSRANLEVMPGDVLFAKMQGTKKTLQIDSMLANYIYSTGFCAVHAKKGILTDRCLYHLLTSETFLSQKDKNCSGATQKAITNAGLNKIAIQVPSIDEQDAISKQFDAIADIIAKRQKQISVLDDLIKARFVEMFGDPELNPMEWPVEALGDVLSVEPQNGLYKPQSDYVQDGTGIPILRIDAFYDGKVNDFSRLKRLNCTDTERSRYLLMENDVVINRVNSLEYLGKCAWITGLIEPTVFESNMMRFHVDGSRIDPCYMTRLLCSTFIYKQILNRAKKAVNQASINQGDVQSFKILVPPIKLQKQFAAFVAQIDKSKSVIQKSLDETQLLFDSMMQQYFG